MNKAYLPNKDDDISIMNQLYRILLLMYKIHCFFSNICHRVANRYMKLYDKTIYMWEEE